MPPQKHDVMVAICTLGRIRIEHEVAFQDSIMPMNRLRRLVVIKGLTVCEARNMAINIAKEQNCDILMFWDDDVIPRNAGCIQRLITTMYQRKDVDVLGGVYPMRGPVPEPIVVREPQEGVWWGWEDGRVHRVYMTGTGFTAIRLDSLKKMDVSTYTLDAPEFADGKYELTRYFADSNGNFVGHPEEPGKLLVRATDDFYFAMMAEKAGLKWYVHGGVVCDQIDLDGTIYRVEQAKSEFNDGPSAEVGGRATVWAKGTVE